MSSVKRNPIERGRCFKTAFSCFGLILIGLCLLQVLDCISPSCVFSQEACFQKHPEREWLHFSTSKTIVYYQNEVDLDELNKRFIMFGIGSFFDALDRKKSGSIIKELTKKIDLIFRKVQFLLDMHNCESKIKVIVYAHKSGVANVYAQLASQFKSSASSGLPAYYFHKLRTVYISVDTVNERILAHEFCHVVVNHYFRRRLPKKPAEAFAHYVETNLR